MVRGRGRADHRRRGPAGDGGRDDRADDVGGRAVSLGLGVFRLAGLVRFLPYPVAGGFGSGTGWLLFVGGISTMSPPAFFAGRVARSAGPGHTALLAAGGAAGGAHPGPLRPHSPLSVPAGHHRRHHRRLLRWPRLRPLAASNWSRRRRHGACSVAAGCGSRSAPPNWPPWSGRPSGRNCRIR